jgi:hypothetical protein
MMMGFMARNGAWEVLRYCMGEEQHLQVIRHGYMEYLMGHYERSSRYQITGVGSNGRFESMKNLVPPRPHSTNISSRPLSEMMDFPRRSGNF